MFFKDRITVDRIVGDSAQALIFFGREVNTGIRVVLKQYMGETFEEILRERTTIFFFYFSFVSTV